MRLISMVFAASLFISGCARNVAPLPTVAPAATPTPAPVQFPKDAQPHDALTEWWYFTGQLQAEDGKQYGFEFTIFQVRRRDAPTGYLAHFAVTDIDAQRFSHQARLSQGEAQTALPLQVQEWSLGADDTIRAAMHSGPGAAVPYALELQFVDEKPPALHYGGFIDNEPAGGSHYYSRTHLRARGSLTTADDAPQAVSGKAWMDHQWGNFVGVGNSWDWYSLQFDDNRELMLYALRAAPGSASAVYGSEVLPDGSVRELQPNEVASEPLGTWVSPHTGAVYPSGWRLTLGNSEQLELRPVLADQELYFPGLGGSVYWEGAVRIGGDRSGRGYVELTGYAPQ